MVNKERVLAEFLELVQISSPSQSERLVADLVKERLTALGFLVTEDDTAEKINGNCGNVLATLTATTAGVPTLLLSAHLDCVEPCTGVKPQVQAGIITSAGDTVLGSDDKAGVAGILEALRVIVENNLPHGAIQVVFTVSEEHGLDGSRNLDRKLLQADFGYALDSGGRPGEIVTMAPGQNSIQATVYGRKAHAGLAPEEGINAIVVAAKALAALQQGRIDHETTANVGIIRGGQATNIVPDKVEVFCEARSRDLAKLTAQTNHMRETFERVAAENGARAEITITKAYDPFVLAAESPVAALAVKAVERVGLTAEIKATGGGSDANFFNQYGVPTAVLGVGMSKVHTTEEFIREQDLYDTARLLVSLIAVTAEGNAL